MYSEHTPVFWFRRDLRLTDNAGLYHALKENKHVIPLFIIDPQQLDRLDNKSNGRVTFTLSSLQSIQRTLVAMGKSLLVLHGNPLDVFAQMNVRVVYANREYEPLAVERDKAVSTLLAKRGGALVTFKDSVVFDPEEVVKSNGEPYTIFTPYARAWKTQLAGSEAALKRYDASRYLGHLKSSRPQKLPTLRDIGFEESTVPFPPLTINRRVVTRYAESRNYPAIHGTTRLGVHLRMGTLSIRRLVRYAMDLSPALLNELIWREFYQMILWHFPHAANTSFKPAYDHIRWRNDEHDFAAWCDGRTGYPLVDAGMRELNATGYMHNRVRMVVASFLTKHLLVDWRWGEAYFEQKLLDYDLASNNGGWQWAAGCGCDAAPYFRVFNPELQQKKFDPDLEYVRRWVPEFQSDAYPRPIVEHTAARERALQAYRKALRG